MRIQFSCTHCGHEMDADEFVAGKSITCARCNKLTKIPPLPDEDIDAKPRLKVPKQAQVFENIAETWKHCPECKSIADPLAKVCPACGFSFVTGKSRGVASRSTQGLGTLVLGPLRFLARLVVLALVACLAFGGYVLFQQARCSQEIQTALEDGNLALVKEDYGKLSSLYEWAEYLHRPNPYDLRLRQFQAREGKTYAKTHNYYFPLLVDKSVWGNRAQFFMKTAWVRFRFANLSKQTVTVSRNMFLLIGLDNNLAYADLAAKADPDPVVLDRNEVVEGALYFGRMFKPPAFLEFNNGGLVVRAPIYINYAMDNYDRDERDWPAGRGADEFPLLTKWEAKKLDSTDLRKLWDTYAALPAPPPEPYTTVFKEANPR